MSLWADRMHQGKRTYGFPPGTLAWMDQRLSLKQRQGCQFGLPRGVFCSQQAQRRQFSRREHRQCSHQLLRKPEARQLWKTSPYTREKGAASPSTCGTLRSLYSAPSLCTPPHFCLSAVLSPEAPHLPALGLVSHFWPHCGAWFGPSILVSPVHSLDHFMDLLCLILMTSECYVQPLTSSTWPFPSVDGCLD